MKQSKRKKLEAAGWAVGSAQEFLGLSDADAALIARQPVIVAEPPLACLDAPLRRAWRFLAEHLQNDDGIGIGPIQDAERAGRIVDPQLMAPRADGLHRPRMWQRQRVAVLHQPQQVPGLYSSFRRKRRRLDLALQPDERLACLGLSHSMPSALAGEYMSYVT